MTKEMDDIWDTREASASAVAHENQRLRAALVALVEWDKRNGGYNELPPLMIAAKKILELKD